MSEFIIVDKGQSCDDVENYEFIETLEGCESALSWFYNNPNSNFKLKPSQNVKDFANPSERPFGCYWYKWTKRFVHPNQQYEKGIKSDNTKRQVCRLSNVAPAGPVYTSESCLNDYLGAASCKPLVIMLEFQKHVNQITSLDRLIIMEIGTVQYAKMDIQKM